MKHFSPAYHTDEYLSPYIYCMATRLFVIVSLLVMIGSGWVLFGSTGRAPFAVHAAFLITLAVFLVSVLLCFRREAMRSVFQGPRKQREYRPTSGSNRTPRRGTDKTADRDDPADPNPGGPSPA
ncbi:MAG: hypothetical protein AAGF47_02305 [Planctomycetota bacterium]